MKTRFITLCAFLSFGLASLGIKAQTNVYTDVIATSPNHTYLKAALDQEGLDMVLMDSNATYTVFAPDNDAFDSLAADLNTDINGLLALSNLSDILTYHVLGVTAPSSALSNGDTVSPLNNQNSIKITVTNSSMVFANHSMVNAADLSTDNGVVHSVDEVLLPDETVIDIALDNGFSTLATAVIETELVPALTDPMATLTVFAPTNTAFDSLAAKLDTDINGLLQLPNLQDILLYHVLGMEVEASMISNGDIAAPLSASNTLKLTKTSTGSVFVNHAEVATPDVMADNGIVHILNDVVLPNETVVDVAIDNGFSTLTTAVITAELVPALSNPFMEYTVFAPTNEAFDSLAADLQLDLNGILALPNLSDILLYHVVEGEVLSTELSTGMFTTLNGLDLYVDISNGVMVNESSVTTPDVMADNGVVHVIDKVLVPAPTGQSEITELDVEVFPNPVSNLLIVNSAEALDYQVFDLTGKMVAQGILFENTIDVSGLKSGFYLLKLQGEQTESTLRISKL